MRVSSNVSGNKRDANVRTAGDDGDTSCEVGYVVLGETRLWRQRLAQETRRVLSHVFAEFR